MVSAKFFPQAVATRLSHHDAKACGVGLFSQLLPRGGAELHLRSLEKSCSKTRSPCFVTQRAQMKRRHSHVQFVVLVNITKLDASRIRIFDPNNTGVAQVELLATSYFRSTANFEASLFATINSAPFVK